MLLAQRGSFHEADGVVSWLPYEGQAEDIARITEQIRNAPDEVFLPVTTDVVLPKEDET